ncbi:hypothetical protein AKJ09_04917 [Labilithrix luteola]|uniref:Uncharacterized protein n=1 Tax=Labilithrix luteola TaxID=1391654 RepID=A0A0K1PXK9_9BACT|nr:hypothetical protein AKJ09_04917 [Labilithrix luteola]
MLVVGAVACGGKILEDPDGGAANAPGGETSETSGMTSGGSRPPKATTTTQPTPPSPPPSSDISMSEACRIVCARNGHCGGADQVACESDCLTSAKGACASSYVTFTKCFALSLDPGSCAMVPPSCESAYCTYATCADKPKLDYCD